MNTIVIVDNDNSGAEKIARCLAAQGYRVIPITGPEEMMRVDGDRPLAIDLVILNIDRLNQNITDILMALRLPFPFVKVILVSASYSRRERPSDGIGNIIPTFLAVPCKEQELLDVVREQLGESLLDIWGPS